MSHPVRVLVVDDSAYLRKVVSEMLNRSPRIEVVGTAHNGRDALEKAAELHPDVITTDLFMPEMDGIEFIRRQMATRPVPVVICSIASENGSQLVAAMEAGAVEFVHKPTGLATEKVYEIFQDLIEKVLTAAQIPPQRLPGVLHPGPPPAPIAAQALPRIDRHARFAALVIGISTGGPQALRWLIPELPAEFPLPVAVVLHMPIGYTGPFAERLNQISPLEVLEAEQGLEMRPGRVIIAQAGIHLGLASAGPGSPVTCRLDSEPAHLLHRPSVDVLFRTAADAYGALTLALVMTGMGSDGAEGAAWVKAMGGTVLTESEETCVVYGMPRSVVELGLSDGALPLHQIPSWLTENISNENLAH